MSQQTLASKTTDHRRLLDTEVEQTVAIQEAKRAKVEQEVERQAQVQQLQELFHCDVAWPCVLPYHRRLISCPLGMQQAVHQGV